MAILTVSRQVASLGDEICSALAEKIGYKFIGRKDIEKRIIEMGFPEEKFRKFDEKKPGFFASLSASRDEYLDYLQTAILEAAQENCILIGRGASIVLSGLPNHISLRFVCDKKIRIARLMEEHGWTEKEALKRIEESDQNRQGFLKSFFNGDINDLSMFHAVFNTGLFDINTVSECVSAIIHHAVTEEKEKAGREKLHELLTAQKIVNLIILKHKLNISFLRADVLATEKTILLHGVTDSSETVSEALRLISEESGLSDYRMKSAISISHDSKVR